MGRVVALVAGAILLASTLGWGQPAASPEPTRLAVATGVEQTSPLGSASYLPPWRLVLHRLFRTGLRRLLRGWVKKLRRGRGLLAGSLAGGLAALFGPCGRLWRMFT